MIDTWTKSSPSGKAVGYKIEGNSEVGFIFSAQMEGQDIVVSSQYQRARERQRSRAICLVPTRNKCNACDASAVSTDKRVAGDGIAGAIRGGGSGRL